MYDKTALFYLKSKPVIWKDFEDLKGLKIGGTLGYVYGDPFTKAKNEKIFIYDESRSDIINLKKLLKGRLDAFACSVLVCSTILEKSLASDVHKITYSDNFFNEAPLYLLVSKKNTKGKGIITIFNRGLGFVNR